MRFAYFIASSLTAAVLALPYGAAASELAITVDDLPSHAALPLGDSRPEIARKVIAALKASGAPPTYGFVNGVWLAEEPASAAVLPAWRAAGFPLGNHTWSHMDLSTHGAKAFEADAARDEPLLEQLMGQGDWRWFRYPDLHEGATAADRAEVRRWLGAHGYRIAAVTMSFGDYAFNDPYARCVAKGDEASIKRLETAYLAGAEQEARRARAMSQAAYGRNIPFVLLLHIGALDACLLPQLLAQYRREGFDFVSLQTAEQDPAYAVDLHPGQMDGPDTLEAAMAAKGLVAPAGPDLGWLEDVCR